jgi:hypothetical protein
MTNLSSGLSRTIAVAALLWLSISARSEPIIGIGNGGNQASLGVLYSIDPLTGAVTAIRATGDGFFFPISPGPIAGSYFVLSPVNHYLESYSQPGTTQAPFGQWEYHGGGFFLTDFAFDSSNGKLFSLTESSALGGPEGLVQLTNTGPYSACPAGTSCYNLAAASIAQAPALPSLSIIEYINGLGLYGTDGHNAYLINETTGATTRLPDLAYTGPIITGLAYDPDSDRLIGVSGTFPGTGPGGPSTIYDIDPLTGAVSVLNSDAPDMYGLAAIAIPEPSTLSLLGAGLFGVWLGRRLLTNQMPI